MSTDTFNCGHERTAENSAPNGHRGLRCRTCKRADWHRNAERRRAAAQEQAQEQAPAPVETPATSNSTGPAWEKFTVPGSWITRAACRDDSFTHAHLFDPIDPDIPQTDERARVEDAKVFCAQCPVVAQCRAYADENRFIGVWGGTYLSATMRKYEPAA